VNNHISPILKELPVHYIKKPAYKMSKLKLRKKTNDENSMSKTHIERQTTHDEKNKFTFT
jgi:hypothetical protein